jgi:hypothetical protein
VQFTKSITQSVETDLRDHPLEGDELRAVGGFRDLYFSGADTEAEPRYMYVFTIEVARNPYLFYRRLSEQE